MLNEPSYQMALFSPGFGKQHMLFYRISVSSRPSGLSLPRDTGATGENVQFLITLVLGLL